MKLGIIIETKAPEKAWNAFRFATTARRRGHEVKVFLMGEGVECEQVNAAPFDVAAQLVGYREAGGEILACGTCLTARNLAESDHCPISTMVDCVGVVEWADKTVTF